MSEEKEKTEARNEKDGSGAPAPAAREFKTGGIHAHFILITCSLLYMINYMDRQVFAVVLEPMKKDLGLTDTQAGIIQTAFLLCIAVFSVPVAYLVDRWSRRKSIALMALIWSAFTYLTGLGRSFLGVLIPRTIVGVGEAGFSAGGTAMISAAYSQAGRSRVMGVFNAFIPLGAAIGTILGGMISARFGGWRTPFYVFAVPGVVLGILALFLRDYKTVEEVDASGKRVGFFSSALALFKIPTLKWVYIGYAMQNITAFSFLVWTPAFLMRAHGIPEDKAGLQVGIISLMAIIGAPLGGVIADLWQKKNPRGRILLPALAVFLAAAFFAVSVLFHFKGIGFGVGILFGVVLMMGLPALSAITQDVVTPGLKGVSWGMCVFCMYVLGGGWAPVAVGALSDGLGGGVFGLEVSLLIASVGGVLACLCFWMASKHYKQDLEKVKGAVLEAER